MHARYVSNFTKYPNKTKRNEIHKLLIKLYLNVRPLCLKIIGSYFNNLYLTNVSFKIDAKLYFRIFYQGE